MAENPNIVALRQRHLLPGEEIACWCVAQRKGDTLNGVVALTDRRLIFYRKGLMAEKFEPWPIERITSVESRKGLLLHDVKVHTSGDELEFRGPANAPGLPVALLVEKLQSAMNQADKPQAPEPPTSDPLAQIARLQALHEAGAITAEEFAAKKTELLARL